MPPSRKNTGSPRHGREVTPHGRAKREESKKMIWDDLNTRELRLLHDRSAGDPLFLQS